MSAANPTAASATLATSAVTHVLVAAFHHTSGPIIEWVHPPLPALHSASAHSASEAAATATAAAAAAAQATGTGKNADTGRVALPEAWATLLPFGALPDGAHASSHEDCFCAFHLPPVHVSPEWAAIAQRTVFATSCARQLPASELKVRPPDVTRDVVQKAVVILSTEPIFAFIREKLGIVTAAYFEQRDFNDRAILLDLYDTLRGSLTLLHDYQLTHGLRLRSLIARFRTRTLLLYKLLLLEKKILFYATDVEKLVEIQYAIVSLVPNLMLRLGSSGSATLTPVLENSCLIQLISSSNSAQNKATAQDDQNQLSNKASTQGPAVGSRAKTIETAGLPFALFGVGSIFQPYLPLQQMHELRRCVSYVAGTTNSMVCEKNPSADAIVNCDTGIITFPHGDHGLSKAALLSVADKRWMENMMISVGVDPHKKNQVPPTKHHSSEARLHGSANPATAASPSAGAQQDSTAAFGDKTAAPDHVSIAESNSSQQQTAPTPLPANEQENSLAVNASAAASNAFDAFDEPMSATDYDDVVRGGFETYTLSMLSTMLYFQELEIGPQDVSQGALTKKQQTETESANKADASAASSAPLASATAPSTEKLNAAAADGSQGEDVTAFSAGAMTQEDDPGSPRHRKKLLDDFCPLFIQEFERTRAYSVWQTRVDARLIDQVEPGHPCEGYNMVANLQDKLQHTMSGLDGRKQQLQASIASAMSTGSKMMSKVVSKMKAETASRKKMQQSAAAVSVKAKELGASLWSSASSYIASKRSASNSSSKSSSGTEGDKEDTGAREGTSLKRSSSKRDAQQKVFVLFDSSEITVPEAQAAEAPKPAASSRPLPQPPLPPKDSTNPAAANTAALSPAVAAADDAAARRDENGVGAITETK